jgi:hypothetical protein
VSGGPPPAWLLRAINPLVRPLLRSPLHGIVSGRLLLLSYVGRTSGRPYTIPIGYVPWGEDEILSFSSRRWWVNLREGEPVTMVIRGRRRTARPAVEESLEGRAELLEELVRRRGPRAARRLFLGLPTDRPPTHAEALDAASRIAAVRFRLAA